MVRTEFVTLLWRTQTPGGVSIAPGRSRGGVPGTYEIADMKKKSHVLGSERHSLSLRTHRGQYEAGRRAGGATHCSILKCLFSTPVWFT